MDVVEVGVDGPGHLDRIVGADGLGQVAGLVLVAVVGLHVSRHEEQRDDRGEEHGQLHRVDSVSAHEGDGASTRASRVASSEWCNTQWTSEGGRIGWMRWL